ncbi:SMI1/KNR4 family protein [Kitasatospora sp. SUK 42]|uniref:SMI1/KNR4 family protein n=1 Tax=Kitasatospora sp. SUK 42 TaxID=1588882 RepID=UPI0018CB83B0|nr:SMI1/KNR4 family protein [Kitasatospora sp. SUK 42]MBV2154930.1 hypothetical protein [Kitasatospora sp. SUK 42]
MVAELDGIVAGLVLPESLLRLTAGGRVRLRYDAERIREVFQEEGGYLFELFDPAAIGRQTADFRREARGDEEERELWVVPGVGIDPERSLLIGSLGADMPIALDYRGDPAEPRVLYCGADGWRVVAENVNRFLSLVGIGSAE